VEDAGTTPSLPYGTLRGLYPRLPLLLDGDVETKGGVGLETGLPLFRRSPIVDGHQVN